MTHGCASWPPEAAGRWECSRGVSSPPAHSHRDCETPGSAAQWRRPAGRPTSCASSRRRLRAAPSPVRLGPPNERCWGMVASGTEKTGLHRFKEKECRKNAGRHAYIPTSNKFSNTGRRQRELFQNLIHRQSQTVHKNAIQSTVRALRTPRPINISYLSFLPRI